MFVKIDRSTIQKNPKAGQTSTVVNGNRRIDFTMVGPLPYYLKDGENCFVSSWDSLGNIEGQIIVPDLLERLLKESGRNISIKEHVDHEVIQHGPLPDYLYEYENPQLRCEHCHSLVFLKDIDNDYDDDGNRFDICPVCSNINTFEAVEYESINNALDQIEKAV